MSDPAPTPLLVSRPLLLGWCAWLLGCWVVNLVAYSPQRSWVMEVDGLMHWRVPGELFIPVARGMMVSVGLSLGLIWPVWRLSLSEVQGVGRIVSDGATLWLVTQVIVWPLRVLVDLSLTDLLSISFTLMAVTVLGGACIAIGRRGTGGAWRAAGAILCAMVLLGPWVAAYVTGRNSLARLTPLGSLWSLSGGIHGDGSAMWQGFGRPLLLIAASLTAGAIFRAPHTQPPQ